VQLTLLLQGQQQKQQQQQAASAHKDVETAGASKRPDATAAVLGNKAADHAASTQQQQYPGAAAALDMSQSPLRARQLQYGEASPGAADDSSQPEFTLSQLVHALQDMGADQAGRGAKDEAPNLPTLEASPAAAAAGEGDSTWSTHQADRVSAANGVDAAPGNSGMYRFPTSTPPEEQQLQAAAEAPQQQQQAAAEPAQAATEPQQQQQRQSEAAVAPAQDLSELQPSAAAAAAAAGLQPCSLSSMAVAFDPRLPAELGQQLEAAVVAADGCVVPGRPHLGCGANTVVAEPQHAAQWLQLLMHIVSPAWLLKACRQQQRQQGCRQQQLVCLSADVARALGQGGKQHEVAAAGTTDAENSSDMNRCSNVTSPRDAAAAARSIPSSGTVSATAQAAGNSFSSSSKVHGTVLIVPAAALSVQDTGLCGESAVTWTNEFGQQQVQQQQQLMPPGLLEGVVWSVDQDPRYV
jgi:hypothetical protein